MSNNQIRRSINRSINESINAELNQIVIQLQEFGYDKIYSRRVFYYLHPEDLEEALNYMSIENGIIQHRFVTDRNISNKLCYICGEAKEIHLKELNTNLNNNNNNFNNNLEKINEEKESIGTISFIEKNFNQENNHININNNNDNDSISSLRILGENYFDKSRNSIQEINRDINNKNKIRSINIFKPSFIQQNENIINKNSSSDNNNLSFDNKISERKNDNNIEQQKEEKIECEICNEVFIVNKENKLEKCSHAFCSSCWFDSLSVKIKENKLPSIKCLEYTCQEKLPDKFILNILKTDINLINRYKRYKLELEIINDPNKNYVLIQIVILF